MRKSAHAIAVARVACGSLQALAGGATTVLGTRLTGFGAALADVPTLLVVTVVAAGVATLVQGTLGIAVAVLSILPRPR